MKDRARMMRRSCFRASWRSSREDTTSRLLPADRKLGTRRPVPQLPVGDRKRADLRASWCRHGLIPGNRDQLAALNRNARRQAAGGSTTDRIEPRRVLDGLRLPRVLGVWERIVRWVFDPLRERRLDQEYRKGKYRHEAAHGQTPGIE